MGIIHTIHVLNPKLIDRVRTEQERQPILDWSGAMSLFNEVGRSTSPDGYVSWDEDEERYEFEGWNLVLRITASEMSWDLDKSLDRPGDGLLGIAALLPELKPVKQLLSSLKSLQGAGLSKVFKPDGEGLQGIATTDVIAAAVPVASKFTQPDARELIGSVSVPWLKRQLGGRATLSSWRSDDYLWNNWTHLLKAVQIAGTRGHWLGLEGR